MSSFWLGIRLALKGSRARVAVTSLAIAFAVAFLLAVLGSLPARQAKLDRLADRSPVSALAVAPADGTVATASSAKGGLQLSGIFSWWRGERITGWQVVDAQPGDPLPPGLVRLPRPGELVVSPALARELRGPNGYELTDRLPGRIVGEIDAPGLSGPRELFAYVGVARLDGPFLPQTVAGFGRELDKAPVPPELRVAAQLGALALLLPVLVLVATATRLSAGARDRRLAAVRLIGGSARQVALVVAGEALVLGVLGVASGLVVFRLLRPVAAWLVPVHGGVYATDLAPPTGSLVAVLLVVPALAVVVSLFAMRRLVVDPLGVRRRGRRRGRAGLWRLVPLATGLVLLGVLWARGRDLVGLDVGLLLGGGALTVIGLAVIAPMVSRLAGATLVRLPGVAARLAGRRLLADPSATARTLTGTVLVVFVGTWLLAFLPIVKVSNGTEERSLTELLPGSTVAVRLGGELRPGVERSVAGLYGVRATLVVGSVALAEPGALAETFQVGVARCADLAALLGRPLPCGTHQVFHVDSASLSCVGCEQVARRVVVDSWDRTAGTLDLPATQAELDLGRDPYVLLNSETLIDPALLPTAVASRLPGWLLVTTDGDPATTERVRNRLFSQGVYGASTLAEAVADGDRVVRAYERAARLGLVLAVLVGGVSLLVASVDALRSRRRDLAALAALGVPARTLRRALLLETAAPLLGCTLLALGAGAYASAVYLSADSFYRDQVGLPWAAWSAVGTSAVLVVLALTTLTLPLARGVARPEHLRTE